MLKTPLALTWPAAFLPIFLAGDVAARTQQQEGPHPCAFGHSVSGSFEGHTRADTFMIDTSDQAFVPADIVLAELGNNLDNELVPVGQMLTLYQGDHGLDRYGRQPVHMFQKGNWIQGKLIGSGAALAYPTPQRRNCRQALLDAESRFTARRKSYWRTRGVEIDAGDLNTLSEKLGRFVMVTGVVQSVGNRKRRLYLNFGENWAHDFTVSVAKQGTGKFAGDISRLIGLKGKRVQIRGVLEDNRGPLIRVIDDVQVQIVK